ncbi:MAG: hypothetical protein D6812_13880, partial [Deltaproteobacteria bacterium]
MQKRPRRDRVGGTRTPEHLPTSRDEAIVAETLFEEMKRFVSFGPQEAEELASLHPLLKPHFDEIVEHFYAVQLQHEGSRSVFTGPAQIERLKVTLRNW